MSAVLPQRTADRRWAGVWALVAAWCTVTPREVAAFALLGLSLGGIMVLSMTDARYAETTPARFAAALVDPLVCAALCLLAWLSADRSAVATAAAPMARVWRLALAVVVGSALGTWLVPELLRLAGLPDYVAMMWHVKDKPPPPMAMRRLAEFLYFAMPAGLTVGVMEMLARRRRTEQAVQRALLEHAAMSRQVLEARLAAMQAQVEPQFLFDVLVDVERLYGESASAGAAQLERLIGHLRVALPRLRESGSTLGAEAELLASYLAVVQGTRHGAARHRLEYSAHIAQALRSVGFHPMLLLPLVQRALRGIDSAVASVTLAASAGPAHLRVALTLTGADACRDDAELERVRERLQALYGGQAVLDCTGAERSSTFTITVPR